MFRQRARERAKRHRLYSLIVRERDFFFLRRRETYAKSKKGQSTQRLVASCIYRLYKREISQAVLADSGKEKQIYDDVLYIAERGVYIYIYIQECVCRSCVTYIYIVAKIVTVLLVRLCQCYGDDVRYNILILTDESEFNKFWIQTKNIADLFIFSK